MFQPKLMGQSRRHVRRFRAKHRRSGQRKLSIPVKFTTVSKLASKRERFKAARKNVNELGWGRFLYHNHEWRRLHLPAGNSKKSRWIFNALWRVGYRLTIRGDPLSSKQLDVLRRLVQCLDSMSLASLKKLITIVLWSSYRSGWYGPRWRKPRSRRQGNLCGLHLWR